MNLFELQQNEFATRHIGPNNEETKEMLDEIGVKSLNELINKTIPENIRLKKSLSIPAAVSENEYLDSVKKIASKNKLFKNYIGQGYYGTIVPSVILRNVFENPGWYTQYTPYQAEISQGRLESLLNYQTMVSDLTQLPIANASLLDEATAAAEAMTMLFHHKNKNQETISANKFFVDETIFPQTIGVLKTRSSAIGIELIYGDYQKTELNEDFFGALVQYPNSNGSVEDYRSFIEKAHAVHVPVIMATDLMALAIMVAPGELNADVAIGSTQRFGVPLGFGGPHAAFFATKDEFKRIIPGRIIGVSIDASGNRCLRMALQTREQHIRREKATSNICTAQALLANMAAMYAVYHGPSGIKQIASRIHILTQKLETELSGLGYEQLNNFYFDTLKIKTPGTNKIRILAEKSKLNFHYTKDAILISIDETTSLKDIHQIAKVFAIAVDKKYTANKKNLDKEFKLPSFVIRQSSYLLHPVFNSHHSESEMMRYIKFLENKDLSLNTSMISLGSCTMKLNAATELIPVSWPEFSNIHPFAPDSQTKGYQQII